MRLTALAAPALALVLLAASSFSTLLDRFGLHAMQAPRSESRASVTYAWYGDERNVAPHLVQRGRKLRHALEERADVRAHATTDGLDAQREVVQTFIPAGMPFSDAEAVLRAAGLDVSTRGPLNTITRQGEEGVRAHLDYVMGMATETLEIELLPVSTVDWRVARVRTRRRFTVVAG